MKPHALPLALLMTFGLSFAASGGDGPGEGTRIRTPKTGQVAPIGSLVLADVDAKPRALSRAFGQAKWIVVHVFDTSKMELLPATQTYDPADVERAGREGGSLDAARAPRSWTLDDFFEQAHARFSGERGFRWIGVRSEDFSLEAAQKELEERRRGEDPPAVDLSGSEENLLRLHLKRRTAYDELLLAPGSLVLRRLGVRSVPAILVFDARGRLLLSWQERKDGDDTNYLLRKIYEIRQAERARRRATK